MVGEQGDTLSLQQGNILIKLLVSEDDPRFVEPVHFFQRPNKLCARHGAPRVQISAFLLL